MTPTADSPARVPIQYRNASATLSPCGLYRYTLTRYWNGDRESITFIMLNPSTADANQDDPTIRRCVSFADAWGYGRLVVVNLFALRATDPAELAKATDPIGPDNDRVLYAESAGRVVVCAWGAVASTSKRPVIRDRPHAVKKLLSGHMRLFHLGLTKGGHPKHPLYLASNTERVQW